MVTIAHASQPGRRKYLVLTAMIFAVAMMSVDQTIVAIAAPPIQRALSLSSTGIQWVINAYLLALATVFAFGGKLSDIVGHRRMVLIGTIGFALSSVLCGAAPAGSNAEAWLIVFRILQGGFAALLFPAALAIVVASFAPNERGRALALFFGITGALTSVGPIAGSFLLPWTWRAIFWINVPIAVIAIALTLLSPSDDERRASKIDIPGTALVSAGMALVVLGLQQSSQWGWGSTVTWACIAGGLAALSLFVAVELHVQDPLIDLRIFAHRGFTADNAVLFLVCACFVPLFFFASVYAQVVLGYGASKVGLYILVLFAGFATGSQIGGRILDRRGSRPAALYGSVLGAVGFALWGNHLQQGLSAQWYWIFLAGAGIGLSLTPVSTDAVNRAPRGSYGEVTGITQTVRNFASSLGLAVLGTLLIDENRRRITASLVDEGVPRQTASRVGASLSSGIGRAAPPTGKHAQALLALVQHDVAASTRTVLLAMAGAMGVSALVARLWMERGIPAEVARGVSPVPAQPRQRRHLLRRLTRRQVDRAA
jgi:EmrB/QacA subfamily drug resistance transporter